MQTIAIALSLLSSPNYNGNAIRVDSHTVCYRNDVNHAVCVTEHSRIQHRATLNVRQGSNGTVALHHVRRMPPVRFSARDMAALCNSSIPSIHAF